MFDINWDNPISTVLKEVGKVIDHYFPDPIEADKVKKELLALQQTEKFKELEERMKAIVAEANSEDKWTSRARPSFLYVIYFYLMSAPLVAFASIFYPSAVEVFSSAVKEWFLVIPEPMWWLFGSGYLGYTGARSFFDKKVDKWQKKL